ncbi:hypothetical protein Vsou_22980 [Vulcanisaeta souniana JCM 11219]|uniref:Uncharacterized protein n=2 Tax=Vulcanisaeta souniana TaxID=164452 RepID=A0A830E3G6_9CREN|nr:hypothetical protein Vsou_22980 [Vulcanisaeta souniana JCM 11219]GGI78383.1 hypothetical protein GCM10007112_14060 [Vulcanisaeta souniana JCM 11219]
MSITKASLIKALIVKIKRLMEVKDLIIKLGIVREKYEMRLRDLMKYFTIPNWHPCACPHGETERAIIEGHIEELARIGGKLLQPMLVLHLDNANYLIADVCIYNALSALSGNMNYVLDRVWTEVWDLGKFDKEDRYVAMAIAATICVAYKNRVLKDVKLQFAKELIKNYVLKVAEKDRDKAETVIEGLRKYEGIMVIVKELADILGMSERNAHRYIIAVLNDDFINELRNIVKNGVSQDDFTNYGINDASAINNTIPKATTKNQLDISKRIYIIQIAKRINASLNDLGDLDKLTQRTLASLSKKLKELSPEAGKSLVSRVIRAIRDNNVEEAVTLIEGMHNEHDASKAIITIDETNTEYMKEYKPRTYRLRVGDVECPEELCPIYKRIIKALKNNDLELLYDALEMLARHIGKDELLWEIEKKLSSDELRDLVNVIINNEVASRKIWDLIKMVAKNDQDNACKLISEFFEAQNPHLKDE